VLQCVCNGTPIRSPLGKLTAFPKKEKDGDRKGKKRQRKEGRNERIMQF